MEEFVHYIKDTLRRAFILLDLRFLHNRPITQNDIPQLHVLVKNSPRRKQSCMHEFIRSQRDGQRNGQVELAVEMLTQMLQLALGSLLISKCGTSKMLIQQCH